MRRGGQRTDPAARCDCRALRNRTARQCQRAAVRADTAAVPCRAVLDAAALHEEGAAGTYQNAAAVSDHVAVADGPAVHGECAFRTDAVSEFFNNAAVHEKFRAVHDPDAGPVGISVGAAPDRASEERELAGLIFFFDRDAVLREDDLALSRAVGDYQLALGDLYASVFRQRDRFAVQAKAHAVRERAVVLPVKRYIVRQVPVTVLDCGVDDAVVVTGKVVGPGPRCPAHVDVRRVVADSGIPAADAVVVVKSHDDPGGFFVIGKDITLPCVPRSDKMRQVGGCQCVVFAPDEPDGIGFDSGRHGFLQIPSHIERDLQVLVKGPVYPDGRVLIFPRVAYKRPDGTVINQNVISPCFPGIRVLIAVAGEPDVAGKEERRSRIDVDSRAGTARGGNAVRHCGVPRKVDLRASSICAVQGNAGFPAGGDVRIAGHTEGSADPDAAQEVPDGSPVHSEGRVLCDGDTFCIRTHDGAVPSAIGNGQCVASLHGEHIPVFRNTAARPDLLSIQTDVHTFIDFELPVDENVVFEIVVARRRGERVGFVPCRPFHRCMRGMPVKVRVPTADAVAVLYPERRKRVHLVRNRVAGSVKFSVVSAPHEIGAGVAVGTGQSLLCRCEKGNGRVRGVQHLDVFDDDADVTGIPADTAAVQVQGNGFHVVLRVLHSVGKRDFQNRTVCCHPGRSVRRVRIETGAAS